MQRLMRAVCNDDGSALVEFAIVLPLLVVFLVGIYDFSGAFNEKQKIAHAAQEGAVFAGAQPMMDIYTADSNPASLQPVVAVVFNSLAAGNVLAQANQGSCKPASATVTNSALKWTYTISGCSTVSGQDLTIAIDRGVLINAGPPATLGTSVEVSYPYNWRFNSAIQLLFPGAGYSATTVLDDSALVHNQT